MAGVYFLELITRMSDAATDQEHLEIVFHSKPQIPDRTGFILGKSHKNPFFEMVEAGRGLAAQGAEVLAIPCVTAHYFQSQLEEEIGIPILHAIEETALYLKETGVSKAGILATDGTVESKLFQDIFAAQNIECLTPKKAHQEAVMHLIYKNVKADCPPDGARIAAVCQEMKDAGAEVILLGCTELSLLKKEFDAVSKVKCIDVCEVLARAAVKACGKLKKEYEVL